MMGTSSIVGTAALSLLQGLCQASLPPPRRGPTTVPQDGTPLGRPRMSPVPPSLRSIQGPDAGHAVLEAVGPEAGDVIIHDLHLSPGVARVLKEVDLVVRAVLGESTGQGLPCPACPVPP